MKIAQAFNPIRNIKHIFVRQPENLQPLDGLRAISILLIIIFHCFHFLPIAAETPLYENTMNNLPYWMRWVWHAEKAMEIFFVLSGFLIGNMLMKEHIENKKICLKRFYIRRYIRLMPLFYLAILIHIPLGGESIKYIWTNLLYINNFVPFEDMYMSFSWSLAVEEQFYLIFPLLLILIYKKGFGLKGLTAVFLSSFVVIGLILVLNPSLISTPLSKSLIITSDINYEHIDKLYTNLYTRYGALMSGVIAAYLHNYYSQKLKEFFSNNKAQIIISIVVIVCLLLFVTIPIQDQTQNFSNTFNFLFFLLARNLFSIAVAYFLLYSLYPKGLGKIIARFLSLYIFYPIAQLSYSMYLFHIVIVSLVLAIMKQGKLFESTIHMHHVFIAFGIATLISFIVSIFTYTIIEKPFMNLRK